MESFSIKLKIISLVLSVNVTVNDYVANVPLNPKQYKAYADNDHYWCRSKNCYDHSICMKTEHA